MTKQQCIETMDIALNYLGWETGTVYQIADELHKRTGIIRTTTVHVYVRDILTKLGVMNE